MVAVLFKQTGIPVLSSFNQAAYSFSTIPTSIDEGSSGTFNVAAGSSPVAYTYWKWNITGATGPTTMISPAEFRFQTGGVTDAMTGVTVSNPGGSSPGNEGITLLSDNNIYNKWLDFNFAGNNATPSTGNSSFIWQFSTAKAFDGYVWYTADYAPRDPTSWNISASNDGVTYTVLHTVTQTTTSSRNTLVGPFTFTNGTIVPDGTTLYWTIDNTTTTNADFSATDGSFNITSGVGSFNVSPTADTTTEGSEAFKVSIRTSSIAGTVVARSNSVTVNDTSLAAVPTVVTTDLLLNLDAENSSSYSGSGSTWSDLSGNSKHGTLRNNPTFNSSSPKSFTFVKNSSQDVQLPLLSTSSTNKTVELWVYVTPPQGGCMFESGQGSGFSIGIGDSYYDNTGSNILILYPSASWNTIGYTYPSTAWYHLVMGLNSFNRFTVWRNGTKIYEDTTQSSKSIVTPATFSYIASCTGDGGRYYDGKIAVVRFYNKLLTSVEVTQNYDALKSRFGL